MHQTPRHDPLEDQIAQLDAQMRDLQGRLNALRESEAPPPPTQTQVVAPPPSPATGLPPRHEPITEPPRAPAPDPFEHHTATNGGPADVEELQRLRSLATDLLSGMENLIARSDAVATPSAGQQQPVVPGQPVQPATMGTGESPVDETPNMVAPQYAPMREPVTILDAGPFADLIALRNFETALGRLPSVSDVYVQSYRGGRAMVELTVTSQHSVLPELQQHLGTPFEYEMRPDGAVALHLHSSQGV